MGVLTKVVDALTGGAGGTVTAIAEKAMDYFPPSMSEQEKAEVQLKIKELEHLKEKELMALVNEDVQAFNERIKDLEGTAHELKAIPFIGPVLVTLRAIQRPAWGFAVMYMDMMVLAKKWIVQLESENGFTPEGLTLLLLNFLILGFIFGERTIKNAVPALIPLVQTLYGKQNNN